MQHGLAHQVDVGEVRVVLKQDRDPAGAPHFNRFA
jgi:hypothetical protein